MAVYTHVSAERIARLLDQYDVGTLVSAKGIAEGVENSNYLIETSKDRFILTLYEKRVDAEDLPFFLKLLDHLAARGQPVPPAIADRAGQQIQTVEGRPACLIAFLPGVSLGEPNVEQARATGAALGKLHRALADFDDERPNALSLPGWRRMAEQCGGALDEITPNLRTIVREELAFLDAHWPDALPHSAIHADLFPDNVLMLDDRVTGIIDFYFACTDIRAYDLAVTHAAWCFENDGTGFDAARSSALVAGYAHETPLDDTEREALRVLARGAALRFLLTRAWDWLNTPADALVTRKDPMAFLRRLEFYRDANPELFHL
ncbi:MAG: homoserine kinase [Pseudomonadota bacterium]